MKIAVENHPDLVRDTDCMALLNVSNSSLIKDSLYKEKMKKEQHVNSSINSLNDEILSIKSDVSKILELLNSRGR